MNDVIIQTCMEIHTERWTRFTQWTQLRTVFILLDWPQRLPNASLEWSDVCIWDILLEVATPVQIPQRSSLSNHFRHLQTRYKWGDSSDLQDTIGSLFLITQRLLLLWWTSHEGTSLIILYGALQELKLILCSSPVLASPDFTRPFILPTDM